MKFVLTCQVRGKGKKWLQVKCLTMLYKCIKVITVLEFKLRFHQKNNLGRNL